MYEISETVLMIGVDSVSDVLIDMAFCAQNKGVATVTVDELLEEDAKWKGLKESEIQKVKDRMKANQDAPAT